MVDWIIRPGTWRNIQMPKRIKMKRTGSKKNKFVSWDKFSKGNLSLEELYKLLEGNWMKLLVGKKQQFL